MADGKETGRSDALGMFQRFVHSGTAGSVVLLASTLVALALANSPWADAYFRISHTKISIAWGDAKFSLSAQHFVNDFLMAIFFFVVGLEIKRELVVGQLSSRPKAALPAMAALGGMVVPALIYAIVNAGGSGSHGWGIPMATDIAFALGVLALFGDRVPLGLKVFLTALAIVDDLGAVLVIAIFYTAQIRWAGLIAAGVCLGAIALAGRARIRAVAFYVALALGVWAAVFASGVHSTVAGVLVALLVPVRARRVPADLLDVAQTRLAELRTSSLTRESMVGDRTQLDAITDLHRAAGDMRPPGLALESQLHPTVSFLILPLFALFNAGIRVDVDNLGRGLAHPVGLGVLLGLVLGKPIGIALFSWAAVRTGRVSLPDGVGWGAIYGAACLGGIGFTMSLFISELAFDDEALVIPAKVGILGASLVAAAWGAAVLARRLPQTAATVSDGNEGG